MALCVYVAVDGGWCSLVTHVCAWRFADVPPARCVPGDVAELATLHGEAHLHGGHGGVGSERYFGTWQLRTSSAAPRCLTLAVCCHGHQDEAKSLVREMFAEHAAWDKVTDAEEDRAIRALMRWAGVISGYAPLVEITRAALIAARQRH